jgi:hypothetical protein
MYIFDGMKNSLSCEGLESWVAGARIPESLYTRMIAHPAYPAAARALAANMMAAGDSDKALDGIFKDAGRYLAAMLAMYLHVSGGLTLPRLKEICAATGFLSPGRARALLIYMRYLGYVVPVSGRARGEPARYRPTESFVASWRKQVHAALAAAQLVDADVGLLLARLDEEAVLESFVRIQGEGLLASAQGADQNMAVLRIFVHRHAGTQVIWSMLLADDETFPPAKPIALSVSTLARRFDVSRIHLRRMLDNAKREGLLTLNEDGTVILLPPLRAMLDALYATQLVRLLSAAAQTLAELRDTELPLAAAGA